MRHPDSGKSLGEINLVTAIGFELVRRNVRMIIDRSPEDEPLIPAERTRIRLEMSRNKRKAGMRKEGVNKPISCELNAPALDAPLGKNYPVYDCELGPYKKKLDEGLRVPSSAKPWDTHTCHRSANRESCEAVSGERKIALCKNRSIHWPTKGPQSSEDQLSPLRSRFEQSGKLVDNMRVGDATLTQDKESAPHVLDGQPIKDSFGKADSKLGSYGGMHKAEANQKYIEGTGNIGEHEKDSRNTMLEDIRCQLKQEQKIEGKACSSKTLGSGETVLGDTTRFSPRQDEVNMIDVTKPPSENRMLGSTTTRLSPRQVWGCVDRTAVAPYHFCAPSPLTQATSINPQPRPLLTPVGSRG